MADGIIRVTGADFPVSPNPPSGKYYYGVDNTGPAFAVQDSSGNVFTFGAGDVSGPSASVNSQITLFSGTSGKIIKAATGTGIVESTAGVISYAVAPTGAIVGTSDLQVLTNKTIDGALNTITDIDLATAVTGILPILHGGTNSSTSLNNNRIMVSSGGSIVEEAAITAHRALASDANGLPVAVAVTDTELVYLAGATANIQDQLNSIASSAGGNSITALHGDGSATGPGDAAFVLSTVLATPGTFGDQASYVTYSVNNKGLMTASASGAIQIAESQVTNLVADLAGKAATGNYLTAVTGDAHATGPGVANITFENVNATPGLFGDASHYTQIQVNSKGLVTLAASGGIQIAESQVTNLVSDLASKAPTGNYVTGVSGDATATGPGVVPITLATVTTPGTYGDQSHYVTYTVNGKGLVTSSASGAIQIAESQVTNLVNDLAGKAATGNYITALTSDVTAAGPGSVPATIAVGAVTDTKGSLSNKPACTVVATTNQALSGTPTIDGQLTVAGTSIALLTGQSTGAENGPWIVQSGAWTRPTWYPTGGTTQAFQFITTLIRLGTVYQGTTWRVTSSGPVIIGTDSTTWVVTPLALNTTSTSGIGSTVEAWDADLDAIAALASSGFAARTGANSWALRTMTGTANHINVTNGLGATASPVWDLADRIVSGQFEAAVSNYGSVLSTGPLTRYYRVAFDCSMSTWEILGNTTGSIVYDIWVAPFGSSPPTVANTITGSSKPTMTSAQSASGSCSAWSPTTLTKDSYIIVNIDSVSTLSQATLNVVLAK